MKKIAYTYFLIIALLAVTSCDNLADGGNDYAPLYKYRMFPVEKVREVVNSYDDGVFSEYAKVKIPVYRSYNGIISNGNYVVLEDGNTFKHYFITNGEWTNTLVYQFADTNGITRMVANESYVAYLSDDTLSVIKTNGTVVWRKSVNPTNLILTIANGTNAIFAYGEEKLTQITVLHDAEPTNIMMCYGDHNGWIVDIVNSVSNQFINIHGFNGFSQKNKYLFLHIWPGKQSSNSEDYGILAYYDLSTGEYHHIGDLAHEQKKYGGDWSDFTIGITADLKSFYVYEDRFGIYAIGWKLEDERTVNEEHGIWRIDISSLRLSE